MPLADRLLIDDLGYTDDGITHVTARFGYMDASDVPRCSAWSRRPRSNARWRSTTPSYFLSTIDLVLGDSTEMSRWRKRLFLATSRITADAAEFFHLPRDRTVILGSLIEL